MSNILIRTVNGETLEFLDVEIIDIPKEDDKNLHLISGNNLVTVYTDNIVTKQIQLGPDELEAMLMMSEMSNAVKSLELSNVMKDANDLFSELAGEDTTLRELMNRMNEFTENLGGNK